MRRSFVLSAACLAALAAFPAAASAALLFGFETEAEAAALPYRVRGGATLDPAAGFATEGSKALRFAVPAWKQGMAEWPSFDLKPPIRDWTAFDRLAVDITNPSDERFLFGLFVTDAAVRLQQGLSYRFDLPARGHRQFVVPLSSFPKAVRRSDIVRVHFFTERPQTDLVLHLDRVVLLAPGEAPPAPEPGFARSLAALKRAQLDDAARALDVARAAAAGTAPFAALEERVKAIRSELEAPAATAAALDGIGAELEALPARAERAAAVARFAQACREAGQAPGGLAVGAATSMEKVLPRDAPFDLRPARTFEVSLARNEKESFQVVVLPAAGAARKVRVRAEDLKSESGAAFPRSQIQCETVGYVQTKRMPPYGAPHVGWWPDPILDFLGPVDIAAGDAQSFWVRVRAPKDQAPGLYRGTLTVEADGEPPRDFGLAVRVRPFTLPDRSPLPLAVTFAPEDHPSDESAAAQAEWRKSDDYPIRAWRRQKTRWADFLADYYLTYDSLYHHAVPDFDLLLRLHGQGRLDRFNLGYWYYFDDGPTALEQWRAKTLPRLREGYEKAKSLGLLDHAYLYGCDEAATNLFPKIERAAAILKAEFPGVPILTTAYDSGYGAASGLKSIDGFCPLTPKYDPAAAAAARAAGRQVWWYICCGPRHPHANMFIEYPAIEGRLLMGAMTARQRPDGFLYYQISIWNSRRPIASGPFTDWDPRSWTTYHGDGSWTCVGPDGAPVPTIRLENFRDGLEDFGAVRVLEDLAQARGAADAGWAAAAKAAIAVPESLVKSMTDYSRDPAALLAWRASIDDLIARAPAPAP